MTWLRIAFVGAMTHAVSDRLMPSLVADLANRGHSIEDFDAKYGVEYSSVLGTNPKVVTSWAFDIGGPAHTNRPYETITVDELAIYVPCEQFGPILRAFDDSKVRRFASGDWYYKLKFWHHATVLTVEQHDQVLRELETLQPTAEKRASAFAASLRRAMGAS